MLEAFVAILEHVWLRNKRNIVILYTSASGPYPRGSSQNPPEQWTRLRNLFRTLKNEYGASIVLAAGNYHTRSPTPDTYPALLSDRTHGQDDVFVVSETDLRGFRSMRSQAFPQQRYQIPETFWAPTQGATCAGLKNTKSSVQVGGTSYAAAMVRLLSHPSTGPMAGIPLQLNPLFRSIDRETRLMFPSASLVCRSDILLLESRSSSLDDRTRR